MVKNLFNKKINIVIVLLTLVLLEGGWLIRDDVRNLLASLHLGNSTSLEAYADRVIEECGDAGYRPSCYEKEIPELMDKISLEDAFKVTAIVQDKDVSYQYCHVLGHEISAREVRKNPEDWKDVVARCPSGMCSNGCLHGGFQEKFRVEYLPPEEIPKIKSDLIDLCEKRENWNPTGLEQASCYHALGHLTMYVVNADIPKAIELCEESALKPDGRDLRQLCFDGVFMQIFQPLEPEDFALIEGKQPTKEGLPSFCGKYDGKRKASCLSESWPLFFNELKEPAGTVSFCGMTEESERTRCYSVLFYVLTAQFNFDSEKIKNYCLGLPAEIRGQCFANAASRMIETDYRNVEKSVSLCSFAEQVNEGSKCFNELLFYSTYNFHTDSEAFLRLCNGLPDPWKETCLKQQSKS